MVVDNALTDGTSCAAEAVAVPFPIRVLSAAEQQGAAHARNVGARAANGSLLLFCDADDEVCESWVSELVTAHRMSGGAIVAGGLSVEHNDDAVRAAYTGANEGPPDPLVGPVAAGPPFAGYLPTVGAPASFAVSRRDYLRVGGMDASYRGGCEETDFSSASPAGGVRAVQASRAQVRYTLRGSALGIARQQRPISARTDPALVRFREHGMSGPSVRTSVTAVMWTLASAPLRVWSRPERMRVAWALGGRLGP